MRSIPLRIAYEDKDNLIIEEAPRRHCIQVLARDNGRSVSQEFDLAFPWVYYRITRSVDPRTPYVQFSAGCSRRQVQSTDEPMMPLPLPNTYRFGMCFPGRVQYFTPRMPTLRHVFANAYQQWWQSRFNSHASEYVIATRFFTQVLGRPCTADERVHIPLDYYRHWERDIDSRSVLWDHTDPSFSRFTVNGPITLGTMYSPHLPDLPIRRLRRSPFVLS